MVNIYPFKGWRFNTDIISDLRQVIAPPYDVINDADQSALYERSPYNYVRIILNRSAGNERYSEAAKTFSKWKKNEILIQDTDPSVYLLCQSFSGMINKLNEQDLSLN